MARIRRVRRREIGAQSLEWIGLGTFVMAAMGAASVYAQGHLGDALGQALVSHIKAALGG